MGYLGTKPANSPLTSELIPNSIITNAKINDVAATKLTGQVPDANAPSGSVIQVVNTTTSSDTTTTSTSYTNFTFLNTSITPISTSSKILVIAQLMPFSGANANMQFTLYRNSTNLGPATGFAYIYGSSSVNIACPTVMTYLDSPSTTSSTTYGVYGKTSTGTLYFNNGNCQLSMTLMEIAA